MRLSAETKVHELLTAYPFLEEVLVKQSPKFEMLRNKMARATIGRVATLKTACGIANIDLSVLLKTLSDAIERHSGASVDVDYSVPADAVLTREQRLQELKAIIQQLHDGGDLEEAKERFQAAVGDVEASEIAAMEEQLIRGGLPVAEVQRLCDVHVGAFKGALDEHAAVEAPPGHPVHTYMEANKAITVLANRLVQLARDIDQGVDPKERLAKALEVLQRLAGLENHYQRKENQLFPLLERYEVTGPSQVMWGVHDQIRASIKAVSAAASGGDHATFCSLVPGLARDLIEMVYKEEKILFPLALNTLTDSDWFEVKRGEDHLGYLLAQPAAPWPPQGLPHDLPAASAALQAPSTKPGGLAGLGTGDIDMEQLNLILASLPVDLSFVDENDLVRFYSEGPDRIFPRSPSVIGRKVQNCHPPKSMHVVQQILDAFRDGSKSVAEFWIELADRFIHIRYFAIRDTNGAYRGCLEVSQDVTSIRALQGQRRLLDWQ